MTRSQLYHFVLLLREIDRRIKMRNDEVTQAMKQMEANFKTHAEAQLTSYMKLLEQYLLATDLRFNKMQQQFAELNVTGR